MLIAKITLVTVSVIATSLSVANLSEGRRQTQSRNDTTGIDTGVRLVVSVIKDQFAVGDPIALKLVLKNVTNEERQLVSGGLKDYQVEIKDSLGRTVSRTAKGEARKRSEVISISKGPITLKAGEEREEGEISLTDTFDLTTPGKYAITVKCRGPRVDHAVSTVESNKLTITIGPT